MLICMYVYMYVCMNRCIHVYKYVSTELWGNSLHLDDGIRATQYLGRRNA